MKLFAAYLKIHIKTAVLFTLFAGVFITVFLLADIDIAPVIYSCVLCAVFSLIVTVIGFVSFLKRHKALVGLQRNVCVSLDALPTPRNITEEDYVSLIKALFAEKCRTASEKDEALAQAADYYTLWAHQIKTPIAAMKLLISEERTEEREQLFRIEQYADMALQYARSEEGGNDFLIREYALDGIIRQVIRKFAATFIHKKITLSFAPTELKVVTDEKWLCFVIGQVLSNALKYTKSGGEIALYGDGNGLVIKDNGIGISPEDLPRIGEKGFTGYNGRADKKSTGIGLYLCKRVLARLGHGIRVESEVGEGTRVFITFGNERVSE